MPAWANSSMPYKIDVYAVIRLDPDPIEPEDGFTIVKIVEDEDLAATETARLNDVNREKGCRYFYQLARLEKH